MRMTMKKMTGEKNQNKTGGSKHKGPTKQRAKKRFDSKKDIRQSDVLKRRYLAKLSKYSKQNDSKAVCQDSRFGGEKNLNSKQTNLLRVEIWQNKSVQQNNSKALRHKMRFCEAMLKGSSCNLSN